MQAKMLPHLAPGSGTGGVLAVSLGEHRGGELVVAGKKYSIRHKLLVLNVLYLSR